MNQLAKLGSTVLAFGALTSSMVQADTLLGVYAGGQMWAMETEGAFATNNDLAKFSFDDERNSSFYIALEHFVPFIPNAKVIRTSLDTSGGGVLSNDFSFAGQNYAMSADLGTEFTITTTDYILYYEILDNDLISIDLGINAKNIDGIITVVDRDSGSVSDASFNGFVPMAYSRAEIGLPFTNWSIFAEGNYLSFNDQTISDVQAAIEYRAIDSLALNLSFQLGYRALNIELEDLDSVYSELDFSGVFAGVEFHF
jgi:outer membrane protein